MRFGTSFTALVDRFSSPPDHPIALAVSGGSDSLALLFAAHTWAKREERDLIAFTVDHRLRPEAAHEAERVAEICQDLGVTHQVLKWTEPHGTQSAARYARYRLLGAAMRAVKARCLLTGHTFDDVVETTFIRRRHGVRDAMAVGPIPAAPLPVWPLGYGITVLRPLLTQRRKQLRAYLHALGRDWINDPSNMDPKFERVRVRQFLSRHSELTKVAVQAVNRLRKDRRALDGRLADQLAKVRVSPGGLIQVGADGLSVRLLMILARIASGQDRDARSGAVADLLEKLDVPGHRQTLGGAWFQRTQTGLLIGIDPAAATKTVEANVFDGRYVQDEAGCLPPAADMSFLVRHARPEGTAWRSIMDDRIAHLRLCLETIDP